MEPPKEKGYHWVNVIRMSRCVCQLRKRGGMLWFLCPTWVKCNLNHVYINYWVSFPSKLIFNGKFYPKLSFELIYIWLILYLTFVGHNDRNTTLSQLTSMMIHSIDTDLMVVISLLTTSLTYQYFNPTHRSSPPWLEPWRGVWLWYQIIQTFGTTHPWNQLAIYKWLILDLTHVKHNDCSMPVFTGEFYQKSYRI